MPSPGRYVDTREAPERLLPLQQAGFTPRALSYGDIWMPEAGGNSTVILENKKIKQLLEDMATGQLVNQIRRICEETDYPILLIEGQWVQTNGTLLGTAYTWEAVWNQLQSLQDLGIRIQLSTGPSHTVQRILQLAEYYGKGYHQSIGRHPSGDLRIGVLSLIYGIETQRAKLLLEKFRTLGAIANAAEDQLQELPGIGPKLSKRIWQFWRT